MKFLQFSLEVEVKFKNARYKAAVFLVLKSLAVIDYKGQLHIYQNAEFSSNWKRFSLENPFLACEKYLLVVSEEQVMHKMQIKRGVGIL